MDTIRQQIYLGALLHDIGKFYQRADNRLLREIIENEQHLSLLAGLICKHKMESDKWEYQHTLWSYLFFLDNAQIFNNIRENGEQVFYVNPYENKGIDNLVNFSIFHHKPQTKLQAIVQIADWISSGMERDDQNAEQEQGIGIKNIDFGNFKYKKVPMLSLFNEINKNGKEFLNAFPLLPLDCCNHEIFPKNINNEKYSGKGPDEYQKNYKKLWDSFNNELKSLPDDSFTGFTESLLYLLKKYTWCIPSSTNDMVHTSLYEHLKTTAAIASCLYDFQLKNEFENTFTWEKEGDWPKIKEGINPLLMVCWDLSGIQKFIYDVSGTKASISLKGRSFYLQLLVESIIQKTIIECNAHWGNVIYSSGGKLFMLLPNLESTKTKLVSIKNEFEQLLWKEHHGKVSICLGMVEFSFDTTKGKPKNQRILFNNEKNQTKFGSLSDLWGRTIQAASEDKGRKFESVISKEMFNPDGQWGNEYALCAVTGVEGKKDNNELVLLEPDDEEPIWVTPAVKKQAEIGRTLKDADYILTYLKGDPEGNKYLSNRAQCTIPMNSIGINHYLFDQIQLTDEQANFRFISSTDVSRVRRLNVTDFAAITSLKGKKCSYGYLFYGGNIQAKIADKTEKNKTYLRDKTFEELCYTDPEKKEKTFLGVLRMDVDGLGQIFSKGIPDEYKSFAAYSTLSFLLDFFFSGYLNTIRNQGENIPSENKVNFKDYVNIIYSGGDDVFAVGRWDKIILFAEEIRNKFKNFTGREDISISGGIAIVGEKFPIRVAANMAGEAEDASKEYKKSGNVELDKNAITFFGETISWQYEWEEVKSLKNELLREIKENRLSKSLLHQIIRWKIIKDENEKKVIEGQNPDLSYRWHTAYYIKRYGDRISRGNDSAKELLKKLQNGLFTGEGSFAQKGNNPVKFTADRYYDLAALAARWAEMEIKENV